MYINSITPNFVTSRCSRKKSIIPNRSTDNNGLQNKQAAVNFGSIFTPKSHTVILNGERVKVSEAELKALQKLSEEGIDQTFENMTRRRYPDGDLGEVPTDLPDGVTYSNM